LFRNSSHGGALSRPYTPTCVTKTFFEVPIKIYRDGKLSRHIQDWKIGDSVEWRGPYREDDSLLKSKFSHLLLVAGGTGLAPFIRIVDELLKDDEAETRIRLIYCVRSEADILFKDRLVDWAKHWNVTVVICGVGLEAELPYLFERVNARLCESVFQAELTAFAGADLKDTVVSVCGRATLEKDVVNYATRSGVDRSKIIRFPA
ncbi:oxidoreductase NAD-binding domain protein, partial [Oesophagostomum dentatum]